MSAKQNEIKKTITSTFIFPLLEIPKNIFNCSIKNNFNKVIISNRFINAYLFNDTINKYQNHEYISLVLNNYQDTNFEAFHTTLTGYENFIDDYHKQDLLVMIFKIPEQQIKDFNLIIDGKYSEISKNSKELILKNYIYHGAKITVPLVLSKSIELKEGWEERLTFVGNDIYSPADLGDQEVWSKLTKEKETLTNKRLVDIQRKITIRTKDKIKL